MNAKTKQNMKNKEIHPIFSAKNTIYQIEYFETILFLHEKISSSNTPHIYLISIILTQAKHADLMLMPV